MVYQGDHDLSAVAGVYKTGGSDRRDAVTHREPLRGNTRPAYPPGMATEMPVRIRARPPGRKLASSTDLRSSPASPRAPWQASTPPDGAAGKGPALWPVARSRLENRAKLLQEHTERKISTSARRRWRFSARCFRPFQAWLCSLTLLERFRAFSPLASAQRPLRLADKPPGEARGGCWSEARRASAPTSAARRA